ncbi:MAG TPA: pitrilysin family protein, partial [Microthrixaceae bacterium]|nr:pitrilysin family protein [Microthrixaceae bacterium]
MGAEEIRRAVALRPPDAHVRRSVLDNGVRVLTDSVDSATSATFAVWVAVGGRDEPLPTAGSSHFLEHLLFKGTPTRSSLDIALEIDGVGGDMNAYTSSEHTAYFARVPATEGDLAIDVLLDVVSEPVLDGDDLEGEREVILSELASAEDDPEDLASVRLYESLFPGHSLGRDVLGTESSIADITRDDVAEFFGSWYQPSNIVVTGAGNVDHEELLEAVNVRFAAASAGGTPERVAPGSVVISEFFEERPVEMVQVALGWRAPAVGSAERYALSVLNHILGTGPSSRLFQHVREERGLTYSISSSVAQYTDVGAFTIQCGTAPSHAGEVIDVIRDDVEEMANIGVTSDELARAKRAPLEEKSSRPNSNPPLIARL